MAYTKQITITVQASSQIELNKKESALKTLSARSSAELVKLETLTKSKKAIDYLNNKWGLLKTMLGI